MSFAAWVDGVCLVTLSACRTHVHLWPQNRVTSCGTGMRLLRGVLSRRVLLLRITLVKDNQLRRVSLDRVRILLFCLKAFDGIN